MVFLQLLMWTVLRCVDRLQNTCFRAFIDIFHKNDGNRWKVRAGYLQKQPTAFTALPYFPFYK